MTDFSEEDNPRELIYELVNGSVVRGVRATSFPREDLPPGWIAIAHRDSEVTGMDLSVIQERHIVRFIAPRGD